MIFGTNWIFLLIDKERKHTYFSVQNGADNFYDKCFCVKDNCFYGKRLDLQLKKIFMFLFLKEFKKG